MDYRFLLDLAIILFSTKFLGIVMKKIGLPQVLGALIAGIILGLTGIIGDNSRTLLVIFAEIGVNLIMFTAGMDTNFKEIKKNGVASVVITSLGVILPFLLGFAVAFIIPGISMKERMFFGVILTATSVGITVATLKELNVLHGKVGASIVTAAILDDIIGIVVLAFFTADAKVTTIAGRIFTAAGQNLDKLAGAAVLLNVLFFFIASVGIGLLIHGVFKFLGKHFPHTRRLSIFGLVICFLYAWAAEELFGVAAITGSFMAGMMLANMPETGYVERRVDMSAYMMFSPIFFANIGIQMDFASFGNSFSWTLAVFSIMFVIVGLASKFIGCGAGAMLCRYKPNESIKVGVGMMVRGEVCLIVAKKGVEVGLMSEEYFPAIIILIILSSILTPIILKAMFKKFPNDPLQDGMMSPVENTHEENAFAAMANPENIVRSATQEILHARAVNNLNEDGSPIDVDAREDTSADDDALDDDEDD